MRWWLLTLFGLVVASLVLGALRPREQTAGAQMLQSLDHARTLRGAIPLVEILNDPNSPSPSDTWQRGQGSLLGFGGPPDSRWLRRDDAQFTWVAGKDAQDPLRPALAEASDAWKKVRATLTGYETTHVQHTMDAAEQSLAQLSDEALVLAWLNADRATLAQQENLESAARQSLLLEARTIEGPAMVIESTTVPGGRVYIFPMESHGADAWLSLAGYGPKADLAWSGTLRVMGAHNAPPDPAPVRTRAIAAAREAWAVTPSSRPAGPQSIQQ